VQNSSIDREIVESATLYWLKKQIEPFHTHPSKYRHIFMYKF